MGERTDVMVVGGAVVDVLLRSVTQEAFRAGSYPVDAIRMNVGGDALNESIVLARLGRRPALVTKLGMDGVGDDLIRRCDAEGVEVLAAREAGLDTAINVVMVAPTGERSFITNRNGSLRKLSLADVMPALETQAFASARAVCMASMFVSPALTIEDTRRLFMRVKSAGKLVCADMTRRKNGETLHDVQSALEYVDYLFPNLEEAMLLTGAETPDDAANAFVGAGVKCVVIKLGGQGCLIRSADQRCIIRAYPDAKCIDTTGAGDTFAASFIAALLEGESVERCGAFANAAASVCVEQLGATAAKLDRAEIERRMARILSISGL